LKPHITYLELITTKEQKFIKTLTLKYKVSQRIQRIIQTFEFLSHRRSYRERRSNHAHVVVSQTKCHVAKAWGSCKNTQ